MEIQEKIGRLDWSELTESLNSKGYTVARNILSNDNCDQTISRYNEDALYRKTVIMERHNFGLGEYRYFN